MNSVLGERSGLDAAYIFFASPAKNEVKVATICEWCVPALFLTPSYDITFSPRADPFKRRRKHETWADLSMLPADTNEPIVFLGGKDYLPLFLRLTAHVSSLRTIFYNSVNAPDAPDCRLVRFETKTKTNWHYECASKLLSGQVGP